jgi:lipoprotein-releasing system ATP-binding protein
VFTLLRRLHAELNLSFIIVTHDQSLAARCDRIIEIVDGQIKRDEAIVAKTAG